MPRRSLALATFAVLALVASAISYPSSAAEAPAICALEPEITRAVTHAESASTLLLEDGSHAVLIGALPPISLDTTEVHARDWPPAAETRRRLETLVSGAAVDLAFAGRRTDRYGQALAQIYVTRGSERFWVQGELVGQGLARAYTLPGNTACMSELLIRENAARTAKAGHWGSGVFQDRIAGDPRELNRFKSTFQSVEGRIVKSAKIRGHQVFDFGSGRYDFSVWVAPRKRSSRTQADEMTPADLIGRRVRVHGWIEGTISPRMTIEDIRHIEILSKPETQAKPTDQ